MGHCREADKALSFAGALHRGPPPHQRHRNPLPAMEAGFLLENELRLRLRALRACGGRPARSPAEPATRLDQPSRAETAPASGLALRATFGRLDPCRPVGLEGGTRGPQDRQRQTPTASARHPSRATLASSLRPGLIGERLRLRLRALRACDVRINRTKKAEGLGRADRANYRMWPHAETVLEAARPRAFSFLFS